MNIKHKIYYSLLIVLSFFFSCKNEKKTTQNTTEEVVQEIPAVNTTNNNTQIEEDTQIVHENFYVSAKSGLNYRNKPKGEVLGKFPLNTVVKVIEHTEVFETIKDNNDTIKGEWVGVQKELDTVYVFNAFLSYNLTISDMKIYWASSFYSDGKDDVRTGFVNISETYFEKGKPENYILPKTTSDTIRLNKHQRQKLLNTTKVSENDTVYIYDYEAKTINRFPVNTLPAIACINIYSHSLIEQEYEEYEYEFGFDIKKKYKSETDENFVYIGKNNPFVIGEIKPIIWKKIDIQYFKKLKNIPNFPKDLLNIRVKNLYNYKYDNYNYYYIYNFDEYYSRLIIVNETSNTISYKEPFYTGEGAELIFPSFENHDSNYYTQYTGKLFKDKPPVFFGFVSFSFGCPSINFVEQKELKVAILCDNRH